MKPPMKLLLTLLGAGSVTAIALLVRYVDAKEATAFHFANGVQVTPIEVKPEDVLTLLDAKIWKFDVVVPDRSKMYNYTLNLCRHGKVVTLLGGLGSGPGPGGESLPNHMTVTVAMVPMGDTFSKAQQVKYSVRVYGGGSKGIFPNPFGDGFGNSEMPQIFPPDDLIYLMSGSKGAVRGFANENTTSIALKIEPLTVRR